MKQSLDLDSLVRTQAQDSLHNAMAAAEDRGQSLSPERVPGALFCFYLHWELLVSPTLSE